MRPCVRPLAALAAAVAFAAPAAALAQSPPPAAPASPDLTATVRPGWSFQITPYAWLPSLNSSFHYDLANHQGSAGVSTTPSSYLHNLDFAGMLEAEARNDRFSILTDLIYMRANASNSAVTSVNFLNRPEQIVQRSDNLSTSTTMTTTVWELAGGYTVARGAWGNADVIAGFRLLAANSSTDYSLTHTLQGPQGGTASFGRVGSLSGADAIWNGIVGARGRLLVPDTGLFVPYYIDVGTGASTLTWQAMTGLGYQTGYAGVSLGYRYLSFQQAGTHLGSLALSGPFVAVNFSF